MTPDTIHTGDCLEWLRTLPDNCVNCCVTSPPYFGLRDYGQQNGKAGMKAATIDTNLAVRARRQQYKMAALALSPLPTEIFAASVAQPA